MVNARFDCMLARKLNIFHPLSPDEINSLPGLQLPSFQVKRGRQLIQEGQTGHQAFVLQTGWACSYKVLLTGSRQIISLPIAGDCVACAASCCKQQTVRSKPSPML
jgi:CRP-like cAMP-binding protein